MAAIRYQEFLEGKRHIRIAPEVEPGYLPDFLFDFQSDLVKWSLGMGRSALFEDCGLGKTIQELVWAENIHRRENKPVLILTPLAVASQFVREGEKFGIECRYSREGKAYPGINITNYERLHLFNRDDFTAVVADESSILKNFKGATRSLVTDFVRKMPYRLLATATAAPNDYIELGTSSEALGQLGYMDMLNRFFINTQNDSQLRQRYNKGMKWRFRGHAEQPFWRWVSSWARALRKPSDLGYADGDFTLPELIETQHLVDSNPPEDQLFAINAVGMFEQRKERRRTISERCQAVADLVKDTGKPALVWCHLNDEGDLLEKLIPDAEQVKGADKDSDKEDRLLAFADGRLRVLVTKPKIGAFGLNFQHCSHITFFPSHSYEQYYQGVRRCWRFGQKNPVQVDIITTDGEANILANVQRKTKQAMVMFDELIRYMNDAQAITKRDIFTNPMEAPAWL